MGMIIVTRPMPWAKPLCDALQSKHIQYMYLPAAKVEKVVYAEPNDSGGVALFLSQSSVLFAPEEINFSSVFAVGPKTAQAVEKKYSCECHQPRPGHYSVAGLLDDLFFLGQIKDHSRLHVFGGTHSDVGRFNTLDTHVTMHPVYAIFPVDEAIDSVPAHGEIWFTSKKLMELFFEHYILTLNEKNLLSYDLVVPTMVCQARAVELGFKGSIAVVSDPRDESFLAHNQAKHRSE